MPQTSSSQQLLVVTSFLLNQCNSYADQRAIQKGPEAQARTRAVARPDAGLIASPHSLAAVRNHPQQSKVKQRFLSAPPIC